MFEGLDTEQKTVSIPYYVHEGEMTILPGWLTAGIRPKSGLYSTRQCRHYKL